MRPKTIVRNILFYSLSQIGGFIFVYFISLILPALFPSDYKYLIIFVLFSIVTIIMHVLLGFYLNREYDNEISYWNYVVIGSSSSALSYSIFFPLSLGFNQVQLWIRLSESFSLNRYFHKLNDFYFMVPAVVGIMILYCFVVALFYKKYK